MSEKYRHIKIHEKEMLELKAQGLTVREIGEQFGLTREQTHDFFKRYNRKKRKLGKEKSLKRRGRPNKQLEELPPSVQQLDKLSQMRYVMASKDRYIKRLEMELELMRDFLSLTERK